MHDLRSSFIHLLKIVVLALILSVGIGIVFADHEPWTGPTAAPPGANAHPSINVSTASQTKDGGVTFNNLGTDTSNGLWVRKGYAQFGSSLLGIGVQRVIVGYGNVWADKYCDRTGTNCYTSAEMYSGGGGGGGGEANTGANVGTGAGLIYRDKTGVTLNFRRLLAGSGVSITTSGDNVTISATGGTGVDEKVKASATDTGAGYLVDKIGGSFEVVANKLQLIGDVLAPGASKYYGTNASGVKGWHTLPSGGGSDALTVKTSSADTTANYLATELLAGLGISITQTGTGDTKTTITNSGVTKIIAGTGITISPTTGVGDVTINSSSGGGGSGTVYGAGFISNSKPYSAPFILGSGWTVTHLLPVYNISGKSQSDERPTGFIYKQSGIYKAAIVSEVYSPYHLEFTLSTSWQGFGCSPSGGTGYPNGFCVRLSGSTIQIATGDSNAFEYLSIN